MSAFLDALHSGRVLLMDGAMGTELQRRGLKAGECGELWNLTHPRRVRAVHQAYADAGAEVLLTNTFQANEPALGRYGLTHSHYLSDYYHAAQMLLKPFAASGRFVLVSIGPIYDQLGGVEFRNLQHLTNAVLRVRSVYLYDGFRPRAYPDSGVLFETCSSPRVRFATGRLKYAAKPALLSLAYQRNRVGRLVTFSGHTPEWFAKRAKSYGAVALGVNCGRDIGMDEIIEIIRRYRAVTDLPLFARPNAGTPTKKGKRWIYPHTPEAMAARLPELLEAGASMVGGCCGTTPEHIAAFRTVIQAWNKKH